MSIAHANHHCKAPYSPSLVCRAPINPVFQKTGGGVTQPVGHYTLLQCLFSIEYALLRSPKCTITRETRCSILNAEYNGFIPFQNLTLSDMGGKWWTLRCLLRFADGSVHMLLSLTLSFTFSLKLLTSGDFGSPSRSRYFAATISKHYFCFFDACSLSFFRFGRFDLTTV